MVKEFYIPDRGDVVWVNFGLSIGHEQKGKRPAIIISRKLYNKRSGLVVACPVTSREKGYPFEISFDSGKIKGVIQTDQIKTFDWEQRGIRFVFRVKPAVIREIQEKIKLLIL